jgi:hypothetical protein
VTGSEAFLPEIPTRDAQGGVAVAFEEIRATVGIVALIYRFLATTPGLLERHWHDLAPNLVSPVGEEAVGTLGKARLTSVRRIAGESLVGLLDGARARNTLDAYRRANSLNLLGMWALLDGVDRPPAVDRPRVNATVPAALLPMADLSAVPLETMELLQAIAAPIAGDQGPVVIPSLWRHFAHDHAVLELLWSSLRPQLTSDAFPRAVADLSATARCLSARLPYRVERLDDAAARTVVARFVDAAIPGMLVTGAMIELALEDLVA